MFVAFTCSFTLRKKKMCLNPVRDELSLAGACKKLHLNLPGFV